MIAPLSLVSSWNSRCTGHTSPVRPRPFASASLSINFYRVSRLSLVLDASTLVLPSLSLQIQQSSTRFPLLVMPFTFLIRGLFCSFYGRFSPFHFDFLLGSWAMSNSSARMMAALSKSCSLGLFLLNSPGSTILLPRSSTLRALLTQPCSPRFLCTHELIVIIFFCRQYRSWMHHLG